jgi:hypothetical protein
MMRSEILPISSSDVGVWVEVTDPDHPFNWTEPPRIIE